MINLSDLRQLARSMSESELQTNVIQLAQALGYKAHAELKARVRKKGVETYRTQVQGDAGFPDLFLVPQEQSRKQGIPDRIIVAELKSEEGHATDSQIEWSYAFRWCGLPVHLWRPSHWFDGTIERTLRGEE